MDSLISKFWRLFWKIDDYGIKIVTWSFWSWKTKNTFLETYLRKKANPNGIVIANVPYKWEWNSPLVDIYFDSKKDLNNILQNLVSYIQETNEKETLKEFSFVPIRLIIDEGHLYFFSRDFKNFALDMFTILTQCRKRSVAIYIITQEVAQIDVIMRRLCPEIIYYEKAFPNSKKRQWFNRQLLYNRNAENTDMKSPIGVEVIEDDYIFPDKLRVLFNRHLIDYFEQKYLTLHVCWIQDVYNWDYYTFKNFILERWNKNRQEIWILPFTDSQDERDQNIIS